LLGLKEETEEDALIEVALEAALEEVHVEVSAVDVEILEEVALEEEGDSIIKLFI